MTIAASKPHVDICPACSTPLERESGGRHCPECGRVVDDVELWIGGPRNFHGEPYSSKRQHGPSISPDRHDNGLKTEMYTDVDGYGNRLSAKKRRQIWRFKREHNRAHGRGKTGRNRIYGHAEIDRIIAALGLETSLKERAGLLFQQSQEAGLFQGNSIEAHASAAIYAVCRLENRRLTPAELAEVSRVGEDRIRNAYGRMNNELGLPVPPTPPSALVDGIASEVGVDGERLLRARELAADWVDAYPSKSVKPGGVAAAAVRIASQETVSQKRVAAAAETTDVTVRRREREMNELVEGCGDD